MGLNFLQVIGVKLKQKKLPVFIEKKIVVVLDLNQNINQRRNNNFFMKTIYLFSQKKNEFKH